MRLIRWMRGDFVREVDAWVDQGLVSPEQASAICRQYGIAYDEHRGRAGTPWLLLALGNLFIGLAVLTLIGANWEEIPRAVRLGGLIGATVLVQSLGVRALRAGRRERAGTIFLLGNVLFGSSIVLIAQIYHLGEHMPDGVFWWALGSLPLALILRNAVLMLFSLVLALIWAWLEYRFGFFPWLLPLFLAGSAYVLCRGPYSPTLFQLSTLGAVLWVEMLLARLWSGAGQWFAWHAEHLVFSLGLVALSFSITRWLAQVPSSHGASYGRLLQSWNLALVLVVLFGLSFASAWEDLAGARWEHLPGLMIAVAVQAGAALALAQRCAQLRVVIAALGAVSLFALAVAATLAGLDPVVSQVATNLALVGVGIALVRYGTRQRVSRPFYLGVTTILLTALLRYADLVGDYVGGAMLFAVLAAMLLGAARYWRGSQADGAKP